MKYFTSATVLAALLLSPMVTWANEPAFMNEKTGTFVAQAPSGECGLAFKSKPFGLTIAHVQSKDQKLTKDGVWLFTFKDPIVQNIASAFGKFGDGTEVKALFDREKARIDFILFEKKLKTNKAFTIQMRAMNSHVSTHEFDLSSFSEAQAVVSNGCKPVGGLWSTIKRKVAGGE